MKCGRKVYPCEIPPGTTIEELNRLSDVEYWEKDGLLFCKCCGWTWPVSPEMTGYCPNCNGCGPRD